MAIYEPEPELVISNPPRVKRANDPLMGELGHLEMRTTLAYDNPHRTQGISPLRIASSREAVSLLRSQDVEPGIVAISMNSKSYPVGVFQLDVDPNLDPPREIVAHGAVLSMLAGGTQMLLAEVYAGGGEPKAILSTDSMVRGIIAVRNIVGQTVPDLLRVTDDAYLSALDEGALEPPRHTSPF